MADKAETRICCSIAGVQGRQEQRTHRKKRQVRHAEQELKSDMLGPDDSGVEYDIL